MTKRIKTPALARLQVTALRSGSPVDDGVAEALEQNEKLATAMEAALKKFRAEWCDKDALVAEAETFARKHEGAKKEDISTQTKATVGCFFKYLDVPEGTIDNVTVDNSKEEAEEGDEDEEDKADDDKEGEDAGDEEEDEGDDEEDED